MARTATHLNLPARKTTMAVFALVIVMFLVCIKAIAHYKSGSISILASLTDSLMDSLISVMALGSILYADRPADAEHRWGHGKIEAVAALVQASVITGCSVFLVFSSVDRMVRPQAIVDHWLAIWVMLISLLLSAVLVIGQRRTLQDVDSLALEADHLNYGGDALMNLGTLGVLFASLFGAPLWIDSVVAIIGAVFMATMAYSVFMKALNMLLDRELPHAERLLIIRDIEAHESVLGWHDLRTRRHGDVYDISFDIEVDADSSLREAHNVAKDLEQTLVRHFAKCDVMIHVDPQGFPDDERHRVKGIHI